MVGGMIGGAAEAAIADQAGSLSFIFQPGGTPFGNVFDDFAELYASYDALAQLGNPPRAIYFDDSFVSPSPIVIPAGAYAWDALLSFGVRPLKLIGAPTIQLADGVTFNRLPSVSGFLTIASQSSSPIVTIDGLSNNEAVVLRLGSNLICQGSAPMILVTADFNAIGKALTLGMIEGAGLTQGAYEVVELATAAAPEMAVAFMFGAAINAVEPNTVRSSGPGSAALLWVNGSSANRFARNQANFSGQFLLQASEGAAPAWRVDQNQSAVQTAQFLSEPGCLHRYDPSGGGFQIDVPPAGAFIYGTTIGFKNASASTNLVQLVPQAGTIDGAAGLNRNQAREMTRLVSDGVSDWMVE